MVILPNRVSFLFDKLFSKFLIFKSISREFKSHMLKTRGENVTPKIFNGSWDQSNANS